MSSHVPPVIADFIYVDAQWEHPKTKHKSRWVRIPATTLRERVLRPGGGTNCFASVQWFRDSVSPREGREKSRKERGSRDPQARRREDSDAPAGANGIDRSDEELHYHGLYFDFDTNCEKLGIPLRDAIDRSADDARKLVQFFSRSLELKEVQVQVWFSGAKGFHVTVRPEPFGIKPHCHLTYIVRDVALDLKARLKLPSLDTAIYTVSRMWRIPNTRHSKTGRYKIELYHQELMSWQGEEFLNHATSGRSETSSPEVLPPSSLWDECEYRDIPVEPQCQGWWRRYRDHYDARTELEHARPRARIKRPEGSDDYPVCIKDLLENGPKAGGPNRNKVLLPIVSFFKDAGFDKRESHEEIESFTKRFYPEPGRDLRGRLQNGRSVVEWAFRGQSSFSCHRMRSLGGSGPGGRVACVGEDRCPWIAARIKADPSVRQRAHVVSASEAGPLEPERRDADGAGSFSRDEGSAGMADGSQSVIGAELLRAVPVTWAGEELLRHVCRKQLPDQVEDVLTRWKKLHAEDDQASWVANARTGNPPPMDDFLKMYEIRLRGAQGDVGAKPFHDTQSGRLMLLQSDGSTLPARVKGETLSLHAHRHEYLATTAFNYWPPNHRPGINKDFTSHANKALLGAAGHLGVLGIPRVHVHDFPAAYLRDNATLDQETSCISLIRTPSLRLGPRTIDAEEFLLKLFAQGRLPLAGEVDVRKFLMALASPFLRLLAPGLLGAYWFVGPPGGGKDFCADLPPDVWLHGMARRPARASFDLSVTDDLEFKRSIFSGQQTVYARAKEAAKRPGMTDLIIRIAGTGRLPARGMRQDEVEVPVNFTVLADSAEDMPQRREVSRRVVLMRVARVADDVGLGETRKEILARAGDLLADIQRRVESVPPAWYRTQTRTGTRPLIAAALATLFSVHLDEVRGRSLDELFEAAADYASHHLTEGERNRRTTRDKDGDLMKSFPWFKLAHFIETMRKRPGYQELFREFPTARAVVDWIRREKDYDREVANSGRGYLVVTLYGQPYAFVLVRDWRAFILVEELRFRNPPGEEPSHSASPPREDASDREPCDIPGNGRDGGS